MFLFFVFFRRGVQDCCNPRLCYVRWVRFGLCDGANDAALRLEQGLCRFLFLLFFFFNFSLLLFSRSPARPALSHSMMVALHLRSFRCGVRQLYLLTERSWKRIMTQWNWECQTLRLEIILLTLALASTSNWRSTHASRCFCFGCVSQCVFLCACEGLV